jgi:hypothetical protein
MDKRWRLATRADVVDVVGRLREEDKLECRAMFGIDPASFFLASNYDTENTYALHNKAGHNVALAGVSPMKDGSAMIWMVGTPDIANHKIEFLRYGQKWLKEVTEPYTFVFNWVDARNTVHLNWLKWCGFSLINRHEQFGAEGLPFYTAVRIT